MHHTAAGVHSLSMGCVHAGLALPTRSSAAACATRASHCARHPMLTCAEGGRVWQRRLARIAGFCVLQCRTADALTLLALTPTRWPPGTVGWAQAEASRQSSASRPRRGWLPHSPLPHRGCVAARSHAASAAAPAPPSAGPCPAAPPAAACGGLMAGAGTACGHKACQLAARPLSQGSQGSRA